MPQKTTAPPDWDAIYATIAGSIGGPAEIETPQLGRVTNRSARDLYQLLAIVRQEAARAAGTPSTGIIVAVYDRGLDPTGGC